MDEELLNEAARRWEMLGEESEKAVWARCEIAAPMWGDRKTLSKLAERVEETEQSLVKYAGAGIIKRLGLAHPDASVEWCYQLSLWPRAMWREVKDWDALADLTSQNLQHLRIVREKLASVGKALRIVDAGVGEE